MVSRCEKQRRSWSARRALAGALALSAVLAACSGTTYGEDSGLSDVGKNIPRAQKKKQSGTKKKANQPAPDPTAVPTTRGTIIIKVVDQRGKPRPLVMVAFTSPAKTKAIMVETDAKGLARVHATPGVWKAEIPTGCVGNSHVSFGGSASRIGVVAGETTPGTLRMRGTRRYMPGPPLKWEAEPPWGVGTEIRASVRLRDVCSDDAAPNVNFEGHMLAESVGPLQVNRYATRSDATGWIALTLYCRHSGDGGSVWFYDRWNESDRVDIMELTPPVDPNARWCGGRTS